jgi:hypothetical protein
MADCMEHCSRYWGNKEGCYGVVWVEGSSGNCWIRNSGTNTSNLKPSPTDHSALVVRAQMASYDTTCPQPDKSIHTLSGVDGLGYTVNCNKVISGFDACFSGVPQPCEEPYFGFHHTETLEQCLHICVDSHPLCKAVSWSPDMKTGFANCWLKTGFDDGSIQNPPSDAGVLHSATITRIDPIDEKCPATKTYVSGRKSFDINCGQANTGTNITSIHTQNVTACMDACAGSDKGCRGVVFDAKLGSGFNNCYLKNTTSTTADMSSAMYAVLKDAPPASSSPADPSNTGTSTSSSSSSTSKAWIAGPVLGGIAAIALLALLALWLRKRKVKNAGVTPLEKDGVPTSHYGAAPAYSPGSQYHDQQGGQGVYAHHGEPLELTGQSHDPKELAGTSAAKVPGSTKYGHSSGVQELP